MLRRYLPFLLIFLLFPAASPAVSAGVTAPASPVAVVFTVDSISYTVCGQVYRLDSAPFIDPTTGRTMVPVRYLAGALGVAVPDITWDPATATVTLTLYRGLFLTTLYLTAGSDMLSVDTGPRRGSGIEMPDHIVQVHMDAADRIVDGRTMLPARWVAQELGFQVNWNGVSRQVIITNE
ncbi:MAG TPA: copper amine oxidase N-terminal domain-containing protein [Spirochaetia bacterium]|nr:copper amine oxidase N-terminal domain-containing protein [Spirochaetia bacterium]